MIATQAPTPGPLSGDDVKLLVKGDWLSHPEHGLAQYWPVLVDDMYLTGPWSFIGRPDADGWMPWSGGENPVPGQRVDAEGSRFVGKLRDTQSDQVRWDRVARFRLAALKSEGK